MLDRETIELKLDERNELLFKIVVQGASSDGTRVRLVCEDSDVSYMFRGTPVGNDEVSFVVPPLKHALKEGQTLNGRVEVFVENRYFSPVEFNVHFKQNVKVVAEGFRVIGVSKPVDVTVTAKVVSKPQVSEKAVQPKVQEQAKRKSVTGLDDKALEDVARSSIKRLLGR